jgi:hypothetical protein
VTDTYSDKYLGEMAGFGVSVAKHHGNDIYTAFTSYNKIPIRVNSTILVEEAIYSHSDFAHGDFQHIKFNKSV